MLRPLPRLGLALTALLALPSSGPAWGPSTHAIVNQRAQALLEGHDTLDDLAEGETGEVFVRAACVADMTFDILRGGKTAPEVNRLLHTADFHAHLLAHAEARGSATLRAFASGLVGHLAGDRVGNREDGVLTHNLFDWPADRDPWGNPVSDPADSAEAVLRATTMSLNKVLVDALVRREEEDGESYAPHLETDLLVEAALDYEGEHALPNDTQEERDGLRDQVRDLARRFRVSYRVLRVLTRRMARNHRIREGAAEELRAPGGGLPSLEEDLSRSAARVVQDLEARQDGAEERSPAAPGPRHLAHEVPDEDAAALAAVLAELTGQVAETFAEAGDEPSFDSLPAAPGGAASDAPDLGALKKDIYRTFFLRALLPFQRWESLKAAVRRQIPALSGGRRGLLRALRLPALPELVGLGADEE